MEHPEVLSTDETVASQLCQIISVEIDLRCVHRHPRGQALVVVVAALDDVLRPGVVVEAGAALRAGHLAVTRVKLAALAEGEAVGLVLAQKLVRLDLLDRDECVICGLVVESTHDGV